MTTARGDSQAGMSTVKVRSRTSPNEIPTVTTQSTETPSATTPAINTACAKRPHAAPRTASTTKPTATSAVARRRVRREKRCVVRSDAANAESHRPEVRGRVVAVAGRLGDRGDRCLDLGVVGDGDRPRHAMTVQGAQQFPRPEPRIGTHRLRPGRLRAFQDAGEFVDEPVDPA